MSSPFATEGALGRPLAPMRMADLTRASGVSTASIKYYLREGLLPPGARSGPNRATYDESHLRRLRIIRALRDVGQVSIEGIRRVVAALDAGDTSLYELMGAAADALGSGRRGHLAGSPAWAAARGDIGLFLREAGLPREQEGAAADELAGALVALRQLNPQFSTKIFGVYVEALRGLAEWEVGLAVSQPMRADFEPVHSSEILEFLVYGTVLMGPVILALRRVLHEYYAAPAARAWDERHPGDAEPARG